MKLFEKNLHLLNISPGKFSRLILLTLLFWRIGGVAVHAQVFDGPGGILPLTTEVWLHADGGTFSSPNWTNSAPSPFFGYSIVCNSVNEVPSLFNFNPGLELNNNNDEIDITPLPPATNMEMYVVFKTTVNQGTSLHFRDEANLISAEQAGALDDYALTIVNGRLTWYKDDPFPGVVENQPVIMAPFGTNCNDGRIQLANVARDNSGFASMYQNASSVGTGNGLNGALNAQNKIELFGGADDNSGNMQGEIAEFIYIRSNLGATDRQKVNSYLALKYGITITGIYVNPNGVTIYDPVGGYGNEVVGIIREDGISGNPYHQRQSKSSTVINGFEVYSGSGYGAGFPATNDALNGNDLGVSGQSLVIGHDGGLPAINTTFNNIPNARMARIFKAQNTGDVGMVTFHFNDETYPGLGPGGDYSLLVSTNATFDLNDTYYPMVENSFDADAYRVEFDAPPGTFFFTVVKGRKFAPGGVGVELAAWYRADSAVFFSGNVSQWRDASGRGKHLINAASGMTLNQGGLNFNHYLDLPSLDREFGTVNGAPGNILGRTMFFVGNLAGAAGNTNDNLLGFHNDRGIRMANGSQVSNPATTGQPEFQASGATAGTFRSNGVAQAPGTNPTFNSSWSIFSAFRGSTPNSNQRFWIGGYDGNNGNVNPNYFNISEAVIYSGDVTDGASLRKIESYFAIKYGITLGAGVADYRNSNDAIIYTAAGNSSNVTIIGRDDLSRLNQKQSRSINPTATITLGLNGIIHPDSNDAHPSSFLADRTFLAVGDNGGDDCWTNQELNMGTRQYLRLGREWKITKTGNVPSALIRISTTATGFVLPTLPPGASDYYLLLDADGDFSTGPPTALLLNNTGSTLEITLSNLQMTGAPSVYFTIGTSLPPSYKTIQPCVGDSVELIGFNLAEDNVCINFSGGPAFGPISLVAASPNNFVIAGDGPIGCLDTVKWLVPPIFTGNHYLTVGPNCGGPIDNRLLNDSLWRGAPLTPDIAIYGEDSIFLCVGDPNVDIANLNGGGGILSIFTYPPATPVPLVSLLDTADFRLYSLTNLFVHSGNIGHHALIYRYPSGCSSADSVHVYIGNTTTATLSYPTTSACQSDTVNLNPTSNPLVSTGGFFSVIGVGLAIDSTTGVIQADLSTAGNYLVTFNPQDSTCALPQTVLMSVQAPAQAVFDYPANVCVNAPPVLPTITSFTPGSFGAAAVPGAALSTVTGSLGFSLPSAPPYTVYFVPTAACRDTTFDVINVVTPILPTFPVPPTTCALQPTVTLGGTPAGGVYTTNNPNLVLSGATAVVSASIPGGPYPITYTVQDANGCFGSLTVPFTILPLDSPRVQYPRPGYCANEGPQVPVFGPSMTTAGIFTADEFGGGSATLDIDPDGTIYPATSQAADYVIYFEYTSAFCNTPIAVDTIRISAAPSAAFSVPSLACESNRFLNLTTIGSGQIGNLELYSGGQVVPGGSALFSTSPDRINFVVGGIILDTSTTYFIQNIYTNGLGCQDTASVSFMIQADENSNFAYLDDLYCANTSNPTPFIYGVGGGYFSCPQLDTTQLDSSTGLLYLINAFTDPDQNQVDSFAISYTTTGTCWTTTTDTVLIREGFDSYFQFPVSITCSARDTISPTDVATTNPAVSFFQQILVDTGGNPIGPIVNIHPQTGVITGLANLQIAPGADTTLFFYHETGAAGLCIERTTQKLEISRYDSNFAIRYDPDTTCGDHVMVPFITGDVSEAYMNNPVGVTYAAIGLGNVDARYSQPGPHDIVMSNRAICGERDSAYIFILGTPDASFDYNAPNICTGDSTFEPLPLATPGGFFEYDSIQSGDDLNLNTSTGVVTVAGSDPGNYWVYYTAFSPEGCVAVDSQFISISVSPAIDSIRANPGFSACQNTPIIFNCFSSGGTVSWFIDSVFTGRTGPQVDFDSLKNGQVVKAILRSTSGCTDSLSVQMEILPPPSVTVVDRPYVVVEADPFTIQLEANQDNTVVIWHADAIGLEIDSTDGNTATMNILDRAILTNGIHLQSDYDPGEIIYTFRPITNGCQGDTFQVHIEVSPNTLDVFIPEVMTPDGNNKNDVWEVRYDSKLTATDYYIEVYNRSGGLVKVVPDLDTRWDGLSTSGQPCGDGVYWWLLKNRAGEIQQGGGLTIRRN